MSAWRRTAIEKLPNYRKLIEQSANISEFWGEITAEFAKAHRDPIDEAIIGKVYEFAWWVVGESDIADTALVWFFEDLPTDRRVRELLPRFMSRDQFLGMIEIFKYPLSAEDHAEFVRDFLKQRAIFERFGDNGYATR